VSRVLASPSGPVSIGEEVMKVRLITSVREALQYDGTVESAIALGLQENPISLRRYLDDDAGNRHWVNKGYWVVSDEDGRRWVLSEVEFVKFYQMAEEL